MTININNRPAVATDAVTPAAAVASASTTAVAAASAVATLVAAASASAAAGGKLMAEISSGVYKHVCSLLVLQVVCSQ